MTIQITNLTIFGLQIMQELSEAGKLTLPQLAKRLEARDGGICALCGTDTLATGRAYDAAREAIARESQERFPRNLTHRYDWQSIELGHLRIRAKAIGFDPHRHTWEADHIVPVVEGGGGCGLDGLRTLCLACHRRETAALAGRRAKQRRRQQPLPGTEI